MIGEDSKKTRMNHEIDFLPASYREAGLKRKNTGLRVVAVVAFISLIGFAAIYQQHLRILSKRQLAEIAPLYDAAKLETQRLAQLQTRLAEAAKRAELRTYLRHPWPRSQLLAAVTESLPDDVELSKLEVLREPLPTAEGESPRVVEKPGEANAPKLNPAQHDLQVLRDEWDKSRVVLLISGSTDNTPALHGYFDQLGRAPLFEKVEVGNVERVAGDPAGQMRFSARLLVRPGYGQPKGPIPADDSLTAVNLTTP
jgi:hypothetical protein